MKLMADDERILAAMDPYGLRAMNYVREHCPARFAAIPNPVSYFYDLGEQLRSAVLAAEEAAETTSAATAPESPEAWLDRLGRANMARLMAEEAVFSEMVYSAMPPETDQDEDDLEWEATWEPLLPDLSPRADLEEETHP